MENRDNKETLHQDKKGKTDDLPAEKPTPNTPEEKETSPEKAEKKKFQLFQKKSTTENNKKPKAKKKRKKRIYAAAIITVVLIIAIVAFAFLRPSSQRAQASYQQTTVQTGTISKTVVGTGNLTGSETVDINIPDSITVKEVLVSSGDSVEKGQSLATVDSAAVQTALSDVQSQLDDLDSQINKTSSSSKTNIIKSNYSGRVKKIYAAKDKEANDIMVEHGALMLISIDGKMAVDFETATSLSVGDSVNVKLSSGSTKTGTIVSHSGSKYTATLTDYGTDIDESVTIIKSGTTLASGKLYVNQPITIAGSGGTIEKIHVSEDSKISVGTKLFTLEDSVDSIEYLQLKSEREELIEQYNTLVSMSKNGAIVAPQNGTVSSINVSSGTVSSSSAETSENQGGQQSTNQSSSASSSSSDTGSLTTAFSISTTDEMILEISIDEMDILSVSTDMEATITFDAIENKTYSGKISHVSGASTGTSGSAKYTAKITLEGDENMRAGMNATATITIEKKENVLTLPVDAIQERGNRVFVYTQLDDDTPSGEVEITTGISDGQTAEILSGLSEGQTVYYTVASSENNTNTGFMLGGMGGNMQMPQGDNNNRGSMPGGDGERPSGMPSGGGQ